MGEAANALRAVTRPHASAVERQTWREWRQSNPMSAAGLASLAGLAVGGTGLAAVFLARALRNARLAKQRKTTEELVDMHMKALKGSKTKTDTASQEEIEEICVSRVHDLRDAPTWRDTTTERTQGAREILQRILVKKGARRPGSDALCSRVLDAQIEFLETAIEEIDSAITRAALHDLDDGSDGSIVMERSRQGRRQLAPSPQRLDSAPVPSAQPPSVAVQRETAGHAVAYDAECYTHAQSRLAVYARANAALPSELWKVTSPMKANNAGVHHLYGHIATWDVRGVGNMSSAFESTQIAAQDLADLSFWDTRQVKNMRSMFHGAVDFNGDISGWNTSNVEDMAYMFSGAKSFNRDISGWSVKSVKGCQFGEGRLKDTFRETGMRHDLKAKIGKRWGLSAAQMSESWLSSGALNLASGYGRARRVRRVPRGYV